MAVVTLVGDNRSGEISRMDFATADSLIFRVGKRLCALSVGHVDEVMRPLPLERVAGAPSFVRGVSIVRGRPIPVVDLREIVGADCHRAPTRLVTVHPQPQRIVGLLVDEVLGIRNRRSIVPDELPPLLADAAVDFVSELARLDGELLLVLRAATFVPKDAWCVSDPSEGVS